VQVDFCIDGRLASVHARSEAELRGVRSEPRELRLQLTAHSAPWRPDYVKHVNDGTAGDLNMIGWTGDFGDPDNFLGTFFQTFSPQFGSTTMPSSTSSRRPRRRRAREAHRALQAGEHHDHEVPACSAYAHSRRRLDSRRPSRDTSQSGRKRIHSRAFPSETVGTEHNAGGRLNCFVTSSAGCCS